MSEYQYSARAKGDHLVLAFRSDDEEGEEWIDILALVTPVQGSFTGRRRRGHTNVLIAPECR